MKKTYESEDSESVDEPDLFQESSDDWTPGSEEPRKHLRRQRKKPRREPSSSEESNPSTESDDSQNENKKKGKPSVVEKKRKAKPNNDLIISEATSTTSPVEKEFLSGAFVIAKKDTDDKKNEHPPIWKIDGKALLQKYIPVENGKPLYKSTSTYSGWSTTNKGLYRSITVTPKSENRKDTVVEFNINSIRENPISEAQESD